MPSIEDIVQVAEALEKSPVIVVRDRCVAVRNRNASCRRCVEACPRGAFDVKLNKVEFDASVCNACGACVCACPTEALVAVQPTDSEVRQAAVASVSENGGRAVLACARIASKRQADPARYAEVPCLSRIAEPLVVELVASGAKTILLVDGNCATCKNRDCMGAAESAITRSEGLLASHGFDLTFERSTGFPEDMRQADAAVMHGTTRRGFFSDAASAAKETAKVAARTTIEKELGYKVDEPSIGERLRVTEDGTLPQLRMPRHEAVLNALDCIGLPEVGPVESRLFGSVDINVDACNSCGMCAVFCPTGALSRDPADKPSAPIRYFEFSAADCVQCGMCADVCWKGALTLSTCVDASELYDFEPRTITMPPSRKRKSPFA